MSGAESSRDPCFDFEGRARRLKRVAWVCLAMVAVLFGVAIYALMKSDEWARGDVETAIALDIEPGPPPDFRFHDVAINPRDGTAIAVGSDASILTFTDTRTYPHSVGTRNDLHSVAFSGDGATAVAVGESGLVLVSTDNGRSWSSCRTDTEKDFSEVALSGDGETIVAVGDNGLVRASADGGKTWTNPGNVTPHDLNGVALSETGKIALAVGDNETILVSINGGRKWNLRPVPDGAKRDFEAVALERDSGIAVVVGDDGAVLVSEEIASGAKARWDDRGDNNRRHDLEAVAFSGEGRVAIAAGRRGAVRFSTDGGRTWKPGTSNVGDRLRAVALDDDGGTAVVVGHDGTILISTDRGRNWIFRDSRTAHRLYAAAYGFDGKDVIAVGEHSTILRLSSPDYVLVPGPSLTGLTEAVMKEGDGSKPQPTKRRSETEDDGFGASYSYLINLGVLRMGTVLIILLLAQYLTSLARYCLRLAAFYDARQDAVRLAELRNAIPRPENIDELEQMMHALTPYGLDFGCSSRAMTDMAMQMAQLIGRGGSTTPGASSTGDRKE